MRLAVLVLSLLGTLLFGGAWVLSFANPLLIERAAREVVRLEVERRVGETVDRLTDSRIGALAQRALQHTDEELARARAAARQEVPREAARVVANMLNPDCECRRRLAEAARRTDTETLTTLGQVRARLAGLMESAYASVTQSLLREFRIVTGSNAIALALLGVVTLSRPKAKLQLALPAGVLVGAVVITGSVYLFNQNWLHTVVFNQYVGLGYSAYLSGVAVLLSDIAFNRARLTTQMVRLMLDAVGSATVVVPC